MNQSNFKKVRLEAGYDNQARLSRDCHIDLASLRRYEEGRATPSLTRLFQLLDFFSLQLKKEVTVHDLFGDRIRTNQQIDPSKKQENETQN